MLRYLFAKLIDEEVRRDEEYRKNLITPDAPSRMQRSQAPSSIAIPSFNPPSSSLNGKLNSSSTLTPRPMNGTGTASTPGFSIGLATPAVNLSNTQPHNHFAPTAEEGGGTLEKHTSNQSHSREAGDRSSDYFTSKLNQPQTSEGISGETTKPPATPGNDIPGSPGPQSPGGGDTDTPAEKKKGLFGKKFKMNFPTKMGRTSVDAKPPTVEEKAPTEDSDKSSEKEEKVFEDNFYGVVQRMRNEYDELAAAHPDRPILGNIQPSEPNETPVLRPPAATTIIIQEDNPDSGGVVDVYRGTVATVGFDADLVEKAAPTWLGDVLLRVRYQSSLPVHTTLSMRRSANQTRRTTSLSKIQSRSPSSSNHTPTKPNGFPTSPS